MCGVADDGGRARRGNLTSVRWGRGWTDEQPRCFEAGWISTRSGMWAQEGQADKHKGMGICFSFGPLLRSRDRTQSRTDALQEIFPIKLRFG